MGVARGAAFCYCCVFIVENRPMEHAMPNSKEIEAKSHNPMTQGYMLGAGEGEHLIHFRDGGNIFIKVDPVNGSNNLALGTQQLPKGSGIPVHRHPHNDEAFYVLEGAPSHSTMCGTLAKEVERFSYPRTRGMVSVVQIKNWFCCGSSSPQISTVSFAKPAADPANRERN